MESKHRPLFVVREVYRAEAGAAGVAVREVGAEASGAGPRSIVT
jgi:hypothetical protein